MASQSSHVKIVCIVHVYPPFTRKQIVSLSFGRGLCTRLGITVSEVPGPPLYHIKVGASHLSALPINEKQENLPACSPQHPLNAERQAEKR